MTHSADWYAGRKQGLLDALATVERMTGDEWVRHPDVRRTGPTDLQHRIVIEKLRRKAGLLGKPQQ